MRTFTFGQMAGFTMVALMTAAAPASEIARGIVFNDANGNGILDQGEVGIPGVVVSDGSAVVVTDENGGWEIPFEGDAVFFVVKPSGYAINTNETLTPQFYYVHRPDGSPDLRYGGVAPTGPLPESINFPLRAIDEPEDFRVVLFADTQPHTWDEVNYVARTVMGEVRHTSGAMFGMTLGDILYDNLSFFPDLIRATAVTGIPFFGVIGNHDIDFDSPDDSYAGETYIQHFGPRTYSFNVGKVHFVGLDNIIYAGGTREQNGRYREGFREQDMEWLARNLEYVPEDYLVVIATHGPIFFTNRGANNQLAQNTAGLFEALKDRKRILAVSGHTHYNNHVTFGPQHGWNHEGQFHQINSVTVSGAWWGGPMGPTGVPVAPQRDGSPQGYTILDIRGNDYTPHFKGIGLPADKQMRIYVPRRIGEEGSDTYQVLVNIFDGMMVGGSAVCRINGGEEREMSFSPQLDPVAQALYYEEAPYRKSWVRPLVSYHMWETMITSGDLVVGTNSIEITYTDTFGREFRDTKAFLHR